MVRGITQLRKKMNRGIKRHCAVQRSLKRTGKSNVRSLDDALNSLTGGKDRRVFSEVPFGKSRVDIVVLVPGRIMIFVYIKLHKGRFSLSSSRPGY